MDTKSVYFMGVYVAFVFPNMIGRYRRKLFLFVAQSQDTHFSMRYSVTCKVYTHRRRKRGLGGGRGARPPNNLI